MSKYSPSFVWSDQERKLRGVCGMCGWHVTHASIATCRAHIIGHPDHIVAMVSTVSTLLSLDRDQDQVVETPTVRRYNEANRYGD